MAALLLVVGGLGFVVVHTEAQRLRATAEAENLRLVAAGAQAATHGLRQTLEAVASLHSLAASLALSRAEAGAPERRVIEALLTDFALRERFGILQVALIDAEGVLAWSTTPGFTPVDLSDREHFRVHRAGEQETFISAPLIGRASGRWSLNISTPVLEANAGFAGVAVVSVDPVSLSTSMGELQFAGEVTVNLLRKDGVILARSNGLQGFLGTVRAGPDLVRINREQAGEILTTSPLSGRAIFLGWRQMPGWPMAVTFSIGAEGAMQDAVRQGRHLQLLLLMVLVSLSIGGLLAIEMRARRAARMTLEAAQASRAEVSRMLDALPGAAYRSLLDQDGTLTRLDLSPAIARITGWPRAKFATAGSFAAIIDPEFLGERRDFYLGIRQTQHGSMEYRILGAAGPIWVRDECRAVSTQPDGRVEVVGLITDITAERQLKALAISASKLATLGEMATGVAHELNQPCAAITLAADIAALELGQGGPERLRSAGRRLEEIARQAMRMRGVIDHFRIFARVDANEETAVAWPEVIAGALIIAGGTMAASGVRVETAVAPGLPLVRGSLVALEQVLVNLLVNARDAMEEEAEERRLVIIRVAAADGGDTVVLTLRDHGHGLPPEALERSFEPFFTTKPVGKGTGLGLSIAYGTVRGFGGDITLRNSPGGGAEAEIRLPVAEPAVSGANERA